jgi:hypothetical protein
MARHKPSSKTKPMIWRISDRAPLGEWVDPNLPPEPPRKPPSEGDDEDRGWRRSTYDLLKGVDIDDNPNTVPDDLFDELFGAPEPKPPQKPPHK